MNQYFRAKFLSAGFFLVVFLLASHAYAISITVELSGSATNGFGSISVGDPLSATYTYDSSAPPNFTAYNYAEYPVADFSGTLGSYVFKSSGYYSLSDNSTLGDQIWIYGTTISEGASLGGAVLTSVTAYFRDYDNAFLSGVDQLTVAPDLSVMDQIGFSLRFDVDAQDPILVQASISSASLSGVAPVPEPSTIILFGLGLVGLASLSRKKKI